ncbi:hypothetical protein HGRIS_014205 [Hohenbuehelia grisea]|uniref:Zinc finger PHD-type domain-containing protein n=1 Tax=Hohenbuehelia grisea TaxID=104357 RepID=A0ABR3JUU6_9AGAR
MTVRENPGGPSADQCVPSENFYLPAAWPGPSRQRSGRRVCQHPRWHRRKTSKNTKTAEQARLAAAELQKTLQDQLDSKQASLCMACQNSGSLLRCDECQHYWCWRKQGALEPACITVKAGTDLQQNGMQFGCPVCHQREDKQAKLSTPYKGLWLNDQPTNAVLKVQTPFDHIIPQLACEDTLLLNIHLHGLTDMHEPVLESHRRLNAFFTRENGQLELQHVSGVQAYGVLVKAISSELQNYMNVVIFFSTHATGDSNLHFIPDHGGSNNTKEVGDASVTPGLC